LDDDAIVSDGWYKEIVCHLKPDVAAVSGRSMLKGFGDMWDSSINAYRFRMGNKVLRLGDRMSTVNVLLKTDVVRDWVPSRPDVSAWEDYEIGQHILRKGYDVLEIPSCCYHILGWRKLVRNCFWSSQSMKKVLSSSKLIKLVLSLLVGVPYCFLKAVLHWNRVYLYTSIGNTFMLLGLFR